MAKWQNGKMAMLQHEADDSRSTVAHVYALGDGLQKKQNVDIPPWQLLFLFFFLNNGGMKERQQRRGQARSLIACNCVTWINNQVLHWKNEFRWVQVTVVTSLESFPILEGISKMLPNSWESSYLPVLDKPTYYLQIKGIQNSLGRAKELADNQSSCCWIDT